MLQLTLYTFFCFFYLYIKFFIGTKHFGKNPEYYIFFKNFQCKKDKSAVIQGRRKNHIRGKRNITLTYLRLFPPEKGITHDKTYKRICY